jgi:hypothetical protein
VKFRLRVDGKDSISEGVIKALEKEGDGWSDEKFEREAGRLEEFVKKYVEDGEGGNDAVTLEFDTDAKTCQVVQAKKARRERMGE